jgi:hypothetical protein
MDNHSKPSVFSVRNVGLTAFGLLLLLRVLASLSWRMEHDSPLFYYIIFMMEEHGAVPYVDIFETSLPGTFLFYDAIVGWFGSGNLAFRLVDLTVLAILLLTAFVFMRRFGTAPAVGASLAFGLIFLSRGPWMSLQRDYFALVPIAAALLTIPSRARAGHWALRFAATGFLFGAAATIKPHLAIGLAVVLPALYFHRRSMQPWAPSGFVVCVALAAVGFCIPAAFTVLWLVTYGAWDEFVSIFANYLPLHTALSGDHVARTAGDRVVYLLTRTFEFGGYTAMILGGVFAVYRLFGEAELTAQERLAARSVVALALIYAFYPTLSGQFWRYHYAPFAFFVSLLASLALYARAPRRLRPAPGPKASG